MCQKFLSDSRFFSILFSLDEDIAAKVKAEMCPYCGSTLHCGNFKRKPRGAPRDLNRANEVRLSFCCSNLECRRRTTPPSFRFLGRKVYWSGIVILLTAMTAGVTPRRRNTLREAFGVDQRTLDRWRIWWKETFVNSDFWKVAKGFFSSLIQEKDLPASLLERFPYQSCRERLVAMLKLLLPMTSGGGGGMSTFWHGRRFPAIDANFPF